MDPAPLVIFESPIFRVLDKPGGWHCVDVRESDGGPTVAAWLRTEWPALARMPEAGLVHRLDRGTTGCLVVALEPADQLRLRAGFKGDATAAVVKKVYQALVVRGLPDTGTFTLYYSPRRAGSPRIRVRSKGTDDLAGTFSFRVLSRGHLADVVEVELIGPGRRHHIRAGLAHLGSPLFGDATYGGPPRVDTLPGAALHAHEVVIDGVSVTAPAPVWLLQGGRLP